MWLKEDIIGPSYKKVYGRKGDKVTVISSSDEMALVSNNGELFYTRVNNLSQTFIHKEIISTLTQNKNGKRKN